MWSNLPFDILSNIFSFLPPDSFARARSACRNWHTCANALPPSYTPNRNHPLWFIAFPTRHRQPCCYVQNPATRRWHLLSLEFISEPIKPIAPVTGGFVLFKLTNSTILLLAICNPFTRQFTRLPPLNTARTNPAVGVVILGPTRFRVYVAGGMSEGATYEHTVEMYDSGDATWRAVGSTPAEYAVRLTVWTPNESVESNGVVYWMTSARAYHVMGYEIGADTWRELSVPMGDRLEFAALVKREGRLAVVGGVGGGEARVWELEGSGGAWSLVEKMPAELGVKLRGSRKCVGGEGGIRLYGELGSGAAEWRRREGGGGGWEWRWDEGRCVVNGEKVDKLAVKALLIHPNLCRNHRFAT